jgi:hypothetical protein
MVRMDPAPRNRRAKWTCPGRNIITTLNFRNDQRSIFLSKLNAISGCRDDKEVSAIKLPSLRVADPRIFSLNARPAVRRINDMQL